MVDLMNNIPETNTNGTIKYFNNFYEDIASISQNENDAIVGYFEQYTENKEAALILAQTVIDTANAQKVDPMIVLDQFKHVSNNDLNAILALFLNINRNSTSLLGIKNQPVTNPYITRTIIF